MILQPIRPTLKCKYLALHLYAGINLNTSDHVRYFLRRAALRLLPSASASIPAPSRPAVARNLPRPGSVFTPQLTVLDSQRRWKSNEVPKQESGSQDGVESTKSKTSDILLADEENAQVIDSAVHATSASSIRPEEITDQEAEQNGRRRKIDRTTEIPPKATLLVRNIFFDVTPADLQKRLEEYGTVLGIRLVTDNRGLSKG